MKSLLSASVYYPLKVPDNTTWKLECTLLAIQIMDKSLQRFGVEIILYCVLYSSFTLFRLGGDVNAAPLIADFIAMVLLTVCSL